MIHWTLLTIGLLLVLSSAGLFLVAMLTGFPRGRRRCPRCAYDLASLIAADRSSPLPTCPECGHRARSLKSLSRWRIRRTPLFASLPCLAAGALLLSLTNTSWFVGQLPRPWVIRALPYWPASQRVAGSAVDTALFSSPLTPSEVSILLRVSAPMMQAAPKADCDWVRSVLQFSYPPDPYVPAAFPADQMLAALAVGPGDLQHRQSFALGMLRHQPVRCYDLYALSKLKLDINHIVPRLPSANAADNAGCIASQLAGMLLATAPGDELATLRYITSVLDHPSERERQAAAAALGSLGARAISAADRLHEMALNDPDRYCQMVASTSEQTIRRAAEGRQR